ncbi:hypothetical protein HYQ46_002136 [Verticillium longisporum]|nr:hypothetical protein HYQ46_002136 [Verticillium longisporum]
MRINSKAQQGSIIHRETLHPISGQLSPAFLLFEEFKGRITILDHGVEIGNLTYARPKHTCKAEAFAAWDSFGLKAEWRLSSIQSPRCLRLPAQA